MKDDWMELLEEPVVYHRNDFKRVFDKMWKRNPHLNRKHMSRLIDQLTEEFSDQPTCVKPEALIIMSYDGHCGSDLWHRYLYTYSERARRLLTDGLFDGVMNQDDFQTLTRLAKKGYIDAKATDPAVKLYIEIKDLEEVITYPKCLWWEKLIMRCRPHKPIKNWL